MAKLPKFCLWFNEVGKGDVGIVGGKGANLGEMTNAGVPVPNGFIVTAQAYFYFLDKTNLRDKIRQKLTGLNVDDSKKLQSVSEEIKTLIEKTPVPQEISDLIIKYYKEIERTPPYVAVRSSATAEDLPDASFAGQQRTFLNIKGDKDVLIAVSGCWASLFEARAIFYRVSQGYDHFKVGIAVPVQKMVQSETSGISFTLDPITNDRTKIVIEAVYGLGEAIVSGSLTPDQYLIDKENLQIISKHIVKQDWQFIRRDKKQKIKKVKGEETDEFNVKLPISPAYQKAQKLPDAEILKLAKIVRTIESHYNWPQDSEWAYEKGKLYIVQTRPVTTVKIKEENPAINVVSSTEKQTTQEPIKGRKTLNLEKVLLLEGLGASPGIGSGSVKVIHSPKDINKIKEGDILVTEMTTPDFVPAMKRAAGIVTDRGGRTCHAAIVSRELGVPCVVGTEQATQMLKTGESVTVNGTEGKVYEGILMDKDFTVVEETVTNTEIRTATKVYVNSGEPDMAEKLAERKVDGIGLLRAEFMIANIGTHPKALIRSGKQEYFVDKLTEGIMRFAKAFDPRPVVYRATDFKTNEYRNIKGGEKYEPDNEDNPMIGYRGCYRYITDPEVFKLELEAIKRVHRYHKNLWIMIPFVRTPEELIEAKKIMNEVGLYRTSSFKLILMVEIPSNVIILEKFIGVGIDGISIGSNDLTQLTLGLDRDNAKVAKEFDERNPAVMWMIEQAVKKSAKHGIMASICGEAPSVYPEITEKLVEWGITSVSVEQDMIEKTRKVVYEAEKKRVGLK